MRGAGNLCESLKRHSDETSLSFSDPGWYFLWNGYHFMAMITINRRCSFNVVLFLLFCLGLAVAQHNQPYQTTTPVPILKQINKHNEDGSYSYGFEAADGSYKIESKYPTGEVYGKYGFVDDSGNLREIEYGASRRGFEPIGPGINVPPPTLTGNSIAGAGNEPEDDGQYREDPSIYHTDPRYTNGERYELAPKHRQQPIIYNQIAPAPAPVAYNQPRYNAPVNYQPATVNQRIQSEYRQQYRSQYQPQYQGQQLQSTYPSPAIPARPQGHSTTSIDVNAGLASYTVNYKR